MIFLAILARGLNEAGVMVLFGSACLLILLGGKVPELTFEARALNLGRKVAALIALLSAPAALVGVPEPLSWMTQSIPGEVFLLRCILLAALAAMVWSSRTRATAWLAAASLLLIAATSHAAVASPQGMALIGAANDGLHLLTAGYWLGGLCVLLALLGGRPSAPRLPQAVAIFAEWGMIAVLLLVMTGILNAAMVLLGTPGHDAPLYLALLSVKIALALAMIVLALVNHFRLLPRLARPGVAGQMRGRAKWELALGLAVVGLAGLLALLPPTHP